jgi:thiol-disulfide isomerase/thioredoxin
MKLVIIIITVLLISSGLYLYSVTSPAEPAVSLVAENLNESIAPVVNETMCTSTACMKKTGELSSSETSVATATEPTETPVHEKSSVVQAVSKAVKKVLPEPTAPKITPATQKYTEFVNPSGFVNSEPFALADYIGKNVILIEFITYSCINCQRTFPYLKQWYETYKTDGLVVIGIHTPEFAYEKDRDNVIAAMKKEGITFPIVQDNAFQTWNAYQNRFWPHRYVIDYNGNVVFDHVGEGAYTETEAVIKLLLENKPAGV